MVPKLRLVSIKGVFALADAAGGIKWFPWVPLVVVGIALGIAGLVMRKGEPEPDPKEDDVKAGETRDDDTGESPVVHRPPPAATGSTPNERIPPRPPPKPSQEP